MDELLILSSEKLNQENKSKEKISLSSFSLLTVIGKGSYAKVVLVKKKDTKKIYALKILKKGHIQARNQIPHIKAERTILVNF